MKKLLKMPFTFACYITSKYKKDIIYLLLIANIFIWQYSAYTIIKFKKEFIDLPIAEAKNVDFTVKMIKEEEPIVVKEENMQEWVLGEWAKVGQREQAYAVIQCESGWRIDAININSNKTYDFGLYQINSIHKDINFNCKADYKCATEYAIKMWQKQGWTPWVCAKNLNIK